MKIVIKKTFGLRQKFHFVIVAKNGKILATSEKYVNHSDCLAAAELIQREIAGCIIHL